MVYDNSVLFSKMSLCLIEDSQHVCQEPTKKQGAQRMKIGPTKGSAGTELTVDNAALSLSKDPNTHTHTHTHTNSHLSGAGDLPQPGI